jgi:SGNH hydrolase-like domain, acetyltransferase AlgX
MIALRRTRSSKASATADPPGDPPKAQAPSYEGNLQGVGTGHALGWCCKPSAPDEPLRVTIVVDGKIVAEGPADVARPNLADRWEGARGFLIALPESLQAPGRHRVLALVGPEKIPLRAAPSFWHDAGSSEGWRDVVFEPDDRSPGLDQPANVPEPPAEPDSPAIVSEGWLFDARESWTDETLSDAELDRIAQELASAARTCASSDIAYIPAIVPNKRRVLGIGPDSERTPAALIARLRDTDDVEFLDLLPVLRDASRHGAVFHRTDPDWNYRGAFFVTRALLKEAHKRSPALQAPPLSDLHLRTVRDYRGALADAPKFESIGGELVPTEFDVEVEDGIAIDAHALHALRMPVESHLAEMGSTHLRVYGHPEREEDTRVAVVGDSAALASVPWIAERSRRTTFFWTLALPFAHLELEMPQVVFHLIRESDLTDHMAAFALGDHYREDVRLRGG